MIMPLRRVQRPVVARPDVPCFPSATTSRSYIQCWQHDMSGGFSQA